MFTYLREDWQRARAALLQQLDLFQTGKMGLLLTPRQREDAIKHLKAAIAGFDALIAESKDD
jgi:hypothetical protein